MDLKLKCKSSKTKDEMKRYFDWDLKTKATRCSGNHNHYIVAVTHENANMQSWVTPDNFFLCSRNISKNRGFYLFPKNTYKICKSWFRNPAAPIQNAYNKCF